VKKKALTNLQRQKRYQWRKKQKLSVNEDRQKNTVERLSNAVAALEGQSFPNQTQLLAALKEQCWRIDVIKPNYATFKKYEHLWVHLIERKSADTQS